MVLSLGRDAVDVFCIPSRLGKGKSMNLFFCPTYELITRTVGTLALIRQKKESVEFKAAVNRLNLLCVASCQSWRSWVIYTLGNKHRKKELNLDYLQFPFGFSPGEWGCRIQQLHLCRGVRPTHNGCPVYDTEIIWWWGSINAGALRKCGVLLHCHCSSVHFGPD